MNKKTMLCQINSIVNESCYIVKELVLFTKKKYCCYYSLYLEKTG